MAHGNAREGKWRGNWRMDWVASTLHTTSEHSVSSITTADSHTSAASSRMNCAPSPADLNGLVRFAERRNLVSARVPSHFNWPLILVSNWVCVRACARGCAYVCVKNSWMTYTATLFYLTAINRHFLPLFGRTCRRSMKTVEPRESPHSSQIK